jgi:hypothetical protein
MRVLRGHGTSVNWNKITNPFLLRSDRDGLGVAMTGEKDYKVVNRSELVTDAIDQFVD